MGVTNHGGAPVRIGIIQLLLCQVGTELCLADGDAIYLRLTPAPPHIVAAREPVDVIFECVAGRAGLRNLALSMDMKKMVRRRSVGGFSRNARTPAVCAMPSITSTP
jgi:hypothetical protein